MAERKKILTWVENEWDNLSYDLLTRAVPVVVLLVAMAGCSTATPEGARATRTPKPTFTPAALVMELPLVLPTITAAPSETPTPPALITASRTIIETAKPTKTATPELTRTATSAPRAIKPTETDKPPPSATPPPKETTKPTLPFAFDPESMKTDPNCGTVYFEVRVTDPNGEPINGQIVEVEFWGNRFYKKTGEGKDPGWVGFAPFDRARYHSPLEATLTVVVSEENPQPLSDRVVIKSPDCDTAGQFKFTFQKQ